MADEAQIEILRTLSSNRRLAHSFLFEHRHPEATPPFHGEIIDLWHSPLEKILIMAMRGGAKSTLSEECIVIGALFKEFNYALVLGNSEDRAVQRLAAIKHELEFNERILGVFGPQVGSTWQEKAIVLRNGVAIHAYGRGQSLRGAKHLDARPDTVFVDDLEDDESVATPDQRAKTKRWFLSALVPAMNPKNRRLRVVGTPLDPEALLPTLAKDPDWTSRVYPARYLDPQTGQPKALWPERFSLEMLAKEEQAFARLGERQKFVQEYLCQASDPDSKAFTSDMIVVDTTLKRTWEPVYVFYDPARTVKKTSADTGKVVFSWVNNRLIVWDAAGGQWRPDEIIDDMFKTDAEYNPIEVGVEKDGLEEFLMQPIRQAQVQRGQPLPVQAYSAPRGKIDFIKGLQPFFKAREVVFAKPLSDLEEQLLSFPTGKIDVPNALAYALKMRAGAPVFNNFRLEHVTERTMGLPRAQMRVAMAATQQFTAGVLLQFHEGRLHLLADAVAEGPPGDSAQNILRSLSMAAGRMATVYAAQTAFSQYDQVGLLPALRRIPVEVFQGGSPIAGREELRRMLNVSVSGQTAVQVSTQATWLLRALSGGYAYPVEKDGRLSDFPKNNVYKVVMEAVESVMALASVAQAENESAVYATSGDGRQYITARRT